MPALRQAYALFKTAHRSSSRINTLHSKIGFCRRTLSSAAHVLLVGRLCLFSSSLACRASVPSLGIAFPRLPRPSPFLSPGASLQSVFYSKLCPSSPPCPLSSKQLRPSAQRSRGSSALPPSMTSLPASLTRKSGASSRAPTHFLAVKLSSPALHASVAAIQEELIRMYGLSMEVMVPPSKLHVTLAVLRLEEEEEEGEEGREERHGEEDVGRRTAGGREEERGAGGRIEGDSVHEPVRWKEEDREGADKGNDATPWSHCAGKQEDA
ncbi:hypothetical protein NGA_0147700 [Nannochloropsis gaditana CCMP526]|uniref:uncharacterized protein n=1 Tax=Nannochloropsis gaditana (strain CCMP526) TaxID=1093141 RepID=UPI00029F5DE4|nr:hypothetical protein NGA_0147700 [Nannochloropsis gaditana CCMP526]EKU21202.1 hypothetical protein NGA_0147700 [Nannochloropsis gaditana CCMP526]|eukprot:XP_005855161.1 hypothetical protein NGA_0147700 [Nannochloropsis gaditana CCMP526]